MQQYHLDTDAYSTSDRLAASNRARKSAQANSSLPAGNGFEGTLLYDPTPNAVLEAAQYAAEHWGFSARAACPDFDPLSMGGCPRGSGCRFYHLELGKNRRSPMDTCASTGPSNSLQPG